MFSEHRVISDPDIQTKPASDPAEEPAFTSSGDQLPSSSRSNTRSSYLNKPKKIIEYRKFVRLLLGE